VPVLLGPDGQPIKSSDLQAKKASPPALGERYGRWAGPEVNFMKLPGGGTIAFDTSQLTLSDLRQMKTHYQINSSLSVLTFMLHQLGWHIEADSSRVEDEVGEQLENVWTRLVRAHSQSLWAGYGPNVLQWENDVNNRRVVLSKIKDLMPEDCRVHWKRIENTVPGAKGAKAVFSVYDGIDQVGQVAPIPVANSYWYPLLMENGNYYGRRILESAFQPWFFSILMHLFANRYYERFGEPVPVGRAPYDDTIEIKNPDGSYTTLAGNELMALIVQQLRSRSTVILPANKTQWGDENNPSYDYTLEYLESQMRGADFERYMTRLDEEMSLAMFTPLLMMRTADVGSYNLGTQHTQVYQWMLNALSGDWAEYINKYIINPIVRYNFSDTNPPKAKIVFTKMGKTNTDLLNTIVQSLITSGAIKIDVRQIGEMTGLTIEEVDQIQGTQNQPEPEQEPNPDAENAIDEIRRLIVERVAGQVNKAFGNSTFGDVDEFSPKMGYRRQLIAALRRENLSSPEARVADVYREMDTWLRTSTSLGRDEFETPENFMKFFERKLERAFDRYCQVGV
jgi:hypothetical protein